MKTWLRKRWKDVLFFGLIGLLLIPQVRTPIQVFVQQLLAGDPRELSENEQKRIAPFEWSLQNLSGETKNLSQSRGNVILINSWATWCPPCIAEMPSLQALYNDFGNRIDFYFVSNENRELLQQWLDQKDFDFPVFQATGSVPAQLNSKSLPTTYVIDRKGIIRIEEVGAHDWNSAAIRQQLESMISDQSSVIGEQ